jgi:hypothetical protein
MGGKFVIVIPFFVQRNILKVTKNGRGKEFVTKQVLPTNVCFLVTTTTCQRQRVNLSFLMLTWNFMFRSSVMIFCC